MAKIKTKFEQQEEDQKNIEATLEQIAMKGLLKEIAEATQNIHKGNEVTLLKDWTHPNGKVKKAGVVLTVDGELYKELKENKFI